MSDFDNNEEDRGYETGLNFNDVFLTVWMLIWIIPITIVFILLIKNRMDLNKVTAKNKTGKGNKIWRLGLIVCLCMYLRELCSTSSWISFITSFDYSGSSTSYIFDIGLFTFWMMADVFLYLFFIYRLYLIYNPNNQSMFMVKKCWYFVLLTLNFWLFISLALILASWIQFHHELYVVGHSLSLVLEITMYAILIRLLSKPMLEIAIAARSTENDQVHDIGAQYDDLLTLLARINILSSIALLTTIFKRIFDISSYWYCPDECWLTFINYSLLPIDSFTNIFCILCSFTTGKKYYVKWCHCLHHLVLTKCIDAVIHKHAKDDAKQDKNIKSVPIHLVNIASTSSNIVPPCNLSIADVASIPSANSVN